MDDVVGRALREAHHDTGRRCTATNRAGDRCGRAPIPGGDVCVMHGGAVPAVRKNARERLLAMVDPALDALLRFLRQAPPCEHCGRSDADRDPLVLRAAQLVLDRTGFHPTLTLQPAQAVNPFANMTLAELADRAELIARRARAAADTEAARFAESLTLASELVEPGGGGLAPLADSPNEP